MTTKNMPPAAVVVMGVSGSGKTTLGQAVAKRLGCRFLDADDFHPAANVAKMAAGIPLDDADRAPWLKILAGLLREAADKSEPIVLACSSLKRVYRDRLREGNPAIVFAHLAGSPEEIQKRLAGRTGHYMPPSLLASQFATLEPPGSDENVVTLDGTLSPEDSADRVLAHLRAEGVCAPVA